MLYFICKIARFYGWDFEKILKMDYLKYKEIIKITDVLEAEERFILQRQLDNHIKINSPKLVKTFTDIYTEFEEVIDENIKIYRNDPKVTEEQSKQNWRNQLATLGKKVKAGDK
jgi:hypothetical protein